ncbi:uncharacterized protein LOC136083502 [Hydra vulgaris]|uniref:Uncharacterized protein LOC136083502 n=1 Tax=Hydra vulgaris TaxID=6087 RepID=A0ABM4CBD2_HYDVU
MDETGMQFDYCPGEIVAKKGVKYLPVVGQVLICSSCQVSGGFSNITGITASARKFIDNMRFKQFRKIKNSNYVIDIPFIKKWCCKRAVLPFKHQNVIQNLSSYTLQDDELDLLNNGLGFALPPAFIKKTDVFAQFDCISQFLNNQLKNSDSKPQLKSELSHLANNYVYKYTPSENCLRKHKILKRLRNNENIVITRPDKGNGIIVLNKIDYINSLHNIISNKTKFKELKEDPTIKREISLQGYLRKLYELKCFEKDIYTKIYPVGSQPARIYALPKMHKVSKDSSLPTFRPIISTIGTYNYNLAKHLSHLLSPYIPKQFCTLDSFSFVEELKQINVTNKFIVSYDVESLFTNIPLKETINIATDLFLKIKLTQNVFQKFNLKNYFRFPHPVHIFYLAVNITIKQMALLWVLL